MKHVEDLKLIKSDGMDGYLLSDIKKHLGLSIYNKFRSWIAGQTVGVYMRKTLVYAHDFEWFMEGLQPLD